MANAFDRLLQIPAVCRVWYLISTVLEIVDVVSDILWLIFVANLAMYGDFNTENGYDNEKYNFFTSLFYATIIFFSVSGSLLISKITSDLRSIFNKSDNKTIPHQKLSVFGLSAFFVLTLSDKEIIELHETKREESLSINTVDALLGLHTPNNFFNMQIPRVAACVTPGAKDADGQQYSTRLSDVYRYALQLTLSSQYWNALSIFAIVLWPFSLMGSLHACLYLIGYGAINIAFYSHHDITIRLLEDVPQMGINIAYLMSKYATGTSAVSYFSMVASVVLLTKCIVEIIHKSIIQWNRAVLAKKSTLTIAPDVSACHIILVTVFLPFLMPGVFTVHIMYLICTGMASFTMFLLQTLTCGLLVCEAGAAKEKVSIKPAVGLEIELQRG